MSEIMGSSREQENIQRGRILFLVNSYSTAIRAIFNHFISKRIDLPRAKNLIT